MPFLIGYCIREAADPPPADDLEGVGGGKIRCLTVGDLSLWYSNGVSPLRELASVRVHDSVVRAALLTATPLPLRFGSVFQDVEAAETVLRERNDEFLETLARVRGRVEMSVLLTVEPPPTTGTDQSDVHTGREFLEMRRRELRVTEAREERAERLLKELAARFDAEIPFASRITKKDPSWLGTLFHLVPRDGLDAYRESVAAAQRAMPDVRLRVTGPWAPYSFV